MSQVVLLQSAIQMANLVSGGVYQSPDCCRGVDQVLDLVDGDDGAPAAGREAAEDDGLVLLVPDEGLDRVLGHQAPVEIH